MIVDNLNVLRSSIGPTKANAPLVIDADAMLTTAIPLEVLQTIARWGSQELESLCRIELDQLACGDFDDRAEPFRASRFKEPWLHAVHAAIL